MLSHVQLFAIPWTVAWQASLSITNSWSLLKLTSIESVMPSNYVVLCQPLLLPSILPSICLAEFVFQIRQTKHSECSVFLSCTLPQDTHKAQVGKSAYLGILGTQHSSWCISMPKLGLVPSSIDRFLSLIFSSLTGHRVLPVLLPNQIPSPLVPEHAS